MFTKLHSRRATRLLAGIVLGAAGTAPALGFSLAGTIFDSVGRERGLDPQLLYAVALAESAYTAGERLVAPYCLAIRAKAPHYPATREKAEELLSQLLTKYKSIDVGCMQVNLRWHGHRVADPRQLLDPMTNLTVASEILKDAIASVPHGQETLGIGRYHSWDISSPKGYSAARNYGTRVMQILSHLRSLTGGL